MDLEDVLMHYASPYYDPQKAHEYYMKNRELKGKRSTSKLSDEGKKVWSYTKENITSEKKSKIEDKKEKQNSTIEELRSNAAATRERISEKLKQLNELLSERAYQEKNVASDKKEKQENITEKSEAEIERIEKAKE